MSRARTGDLAHGDPPEGQGQVFLGVVSLAAITPRLGVSIVTSAVLRAYGVWDYRRTGGGPKTVATTLTVRPEDATLATTTPPTVLE